MCELAWFHQSAPLSGRRQLTRTVPHRLCDEHQLADAVTLADGSAARLCQRCHRLHPLSEFWGAKHSCNASLEALAAGARRRRLKAAASNAEAHKASLLPPPTLPQHGGASSSDDASAVVTPSAVRLSDDAVRWLNTYAARELIGAPAAAAAAAADRAAAAPPHAILARLSSAPGANLAAAAAALALHGFSMELKLPQCDSPASLPPAAALRTALAAALPDAAAAPTCALLQGCVLLVVDALLTAPPEGPPGAQAERVAAALRAAGVNDYASARGAFVAVGGSRRTLGAPAAVVATSCEMPTLWVLPRALLGPAAAVDSDEEATTLPYHIGSSDADTLSVTLHARCAGHRVRLQLEAGAQQQRARVHGADAIAVGPGALLLQAWARDDAAGGALAAVASAPRCVLLCGGDAALAAQVNATCAQLGLLDASSCAHFGAADAAMQRVMRVLGDALRPHAPLRVRQAAAAAAVWLGWDAAAAALLRVMQAEHDTAVAQSERGEEDDASTAVALHMAAHALAARTAGCAPNADAVMEALSPVLGAPAADVAAAAWRVACAALLHASEEDGHADPACAVAAARHAVARSDAPPALKARALHVLRAVGLLVREREAAAAEHTPVDDEAAGAGGHAAPDLAPGALPSSALAEDEAEERAYDAFLMAENRSMWQATSVLGLLGAVMYVVQAVRQVAWRDDWPSPHDLAVSLPMLEATALRRPAWVRDAARVVRPRDVPWPAVRRATAVYVAYSALVLIPAYVTLVMLAWRKVVPRWRHAPTHFVLLAVTDTISFQVCDALVFHACGAVPEYPVDVPMFVRALGALITVQRGMARPEVMRVVFAHRTLCHVGALVATGHGRVLLTNYAYAANAAVWLYCTVTVGARERKLRAAFAAQRRARSEKKVA
jgi:hypothetical protein